MAYSFTTPLWRTPDPGVWHFLTLPTAVADDIDERTTGRQGGFGSVKVEVSIGATAWLTSVFPSKELQSFILPVKQAVRKAEGLAVGDDVDVELRIVGLDT